MSESTLSRGRYLELLILLGMLQAVPPLSIDMYLPALPVMETVFQATAHAVEVTMVTFLFGFALGQTLYGPITDRFGRKPPLYVSLALFVVSSVACAYSPSISVMSFFRLTQALGACGGAVIARAIVRDIFPAERLRRVFSMLILVLGVSPVIAPLFGSYLLLWFGWRAPFLGQAVLGTLCLLGMHFRLNESLAKEARRPLDWSAIRSAYSELFRDRAFVGASLVCGFSAAGTFAYIASAPFVFIVLYKVPTEHFGWLFGTIACGMIAASQINGRLPHNMPISKILRVANIVQLCSAMFLLAAVLSGFGGLAAVYGGIFFYVAGQGFIIPNGSTIAMMRHGRIAGSASAMLGTNQFLVPAITTTLLGYVENPAVPMAFVIAGAAVCSVATNFLTLGSKLDS